MSPALPGSAPPRVHARRAFVLALAGSIAIHLAISLWPQEPPASPDSAPLTATLTEMPPPPKVAAGAAPNPPAKRKPAARKSVPAPPPIGAVPDEAAPEAGPGSGASGTESAAAATAEPAVQDAQPEVIAGAAVVARTLPARVDLAYKVYYGMQGFLIGEATYRFEHEANRYRIATVGQARGLAALILRGQGKVESRGLITPTGLQPEELDVERGGPDRRESAVFDWEAGIVTLAENKTAALELPTHDPLSVMWEFYFSPPTEDSRTYAVATTRRVVRYTIAREGTETIEWPHGVLETQRWHRQSDDGKTDAYVWLAPSLNYVPVKLRVTNTVRGTLEVVLDAIRVDEARPE
jgi:hypothetical protein